MKLFITILALSTLFFACRKPDPNPELKDPIYIDMQKRLSEYERDYKFAVEEKKRLVEFIKTTHPQDTTLKNKRKTYYMNEKDLKKAEQKLDYIKIAIEKRKKEVQIRYLKAFQQNKEDSWQKKSEIRAYKSRVENNKFLEVVE